MRNGLNISGVSELVHEIQENPEEAPIVFDVAGTWKRGAAVTEVRTAHYGTIRMARGWTIESSAETRTDRSLPSPPELMMAALGACVLVTHAHGYSARGISLTGLDVAVTGAFRYRPPEDDDGRAGPRLFEDLRYVIDVGCDGDDDQMRALSQFVTCFSPNHRAFIDEGSVHLELATGDGGTETISALRSPAVPTRAAADDFGPAKCDVRADLAWEYATQAHVQMRLGAALDPQERRHAITIDQAKQMVGLDSGANPQELLLAGIVSELLHGVIDEAARSDVEIGDLRIESGGRLDIRGMLNVDPSVPARFHDVGLRVVVGSSAPRAEIERVVQAAIDRSLGLASLRFAYPIGLTLRRGDEVLLELDSDGEQVRRFLELMAEKAHALQNEG